jgi:hypothetical protein
MISTIVRAPAEAAFVVVELVSGEGGEDMLFQKGAAGYAGSTFNHADVVAIEKCEIYRP